MFDGVFEPAAPRRNQRSLDARKLLPLLRAHANGVAVDAVAVAIAKAAVELAEEQLTTWIAAQPDEPLLTGAELDAAINELLTPAPAPSPEQVRDGHNAIADYLLTSPELDEVSSALATLLGACTANSLQAVEDAAEGVRLAVNSALRDGYDATCLRHVILYWSRSTPGAPIIAVSRDALSPRGVSRA